MKKTLTVLAFSLAQAAMVSAFAQTPATNPGASPSRADVKAGASAANADKVNQFEDKPGAGTGARSRADVKAERNAGAEQLRANTEVPTPGTSSQPNLKNPKAMTAEEKAQRRADRKAKREARRAKHAHSTANATRPADGGAGTGLGESATGSGTMSK
ncbi:hypothetical protein [Noviherbaspirillum pedocola]|uniref:Uncharacterized protein n=1 Tax=Noviherbaspirillum pedocola TaxID=2801341 RepID=A0A934W5V5_9BURK|nr:hypothetical protein [Noviherbaspirillum pedocola]MBK4733618.1 hypothetical protein [Noviherbaspirillum pedocola]